MVNLRERHCCCRLYSTDGGGCIRQEVHLRVILYIRTDALFGASASAQYLCFILESGCYCTASTVCCCLLYCCSLPICYPDSTDSRYQFALHAALCNGRCSESVVACLAVPRARIMWPAFALPCLEPCCNASW